MASGSSYRGRWIQFLIDLLYSPVVLRLSLGRRLLSGVLGWLPAGESLILRVPEYRMVLYPREDSLARRIVLDGPWEPFETRVFRSLLGPGMRVIDLGANFGHYSLLAGLAVGPDGRVDALEPLPANVRTLRINAGLNGLSALHVHQAACGDRDGEVDFFPDLDNPGGHSLTQGNTLRGDAPLKVPVFRLDTFLAREAPERPPHLIKMDTQGAEAAILRGAEETLIRYRPLLVVEFWPWGLRNSGEQPSRLPARLEELGYTLSDIREGERELRETSARELAERYPDHVDWAFTNLLARPRAD